MFGGTLRVCRVHTPLFYHYYYYYCYYYCSDDNLIRLALGVYLQLLEAQEVRNSLRSRNEVNGV